MLKCLNKIVIKIKNLTDMLQIKLVEPDQQLKPSQLKNQIYSFINLYLLNLKKIEANEGGKRQADFLAVLEFVCSEFHQSKANGPFFSCASRTASKIVGQFEQQPTDGAASWL